MGVVLPFTFCTCQDGPCNESHESDEGHEGHEGWWCSLPVWCELCRCRKHWFEAKASEGHCRRSHGHCCRSVEEEWFFQVRRYVEHEVEEEACNPSTQGCQPVHQGALRLQGQAGFQDSSCLGHEKAQGIHQLRRPGTSVGAGPQIFHPLSLGGRSRWAESFRHVQSTLCL